VEMVGEVEVEWGQEEMFGRGRQEIMGYDLCGRVWGGRKGLMGKGVGVPER